MGVGFLAFCGSLGLICAECMEHFAYTWLEFMAAHVGKSSIHGAGAPDGVKKTRHFVLIPVQSVSTFPFFHSCIGCGRSVSAGCETLLESNIQHTLGTYPRPESPTLLCLGIPVSFGGDFYGPPGDRCLLTEMDPENLGDFGAQDLANVAWASWI